MSTARRHLASSSLWAFGGFTTLALASVAVNATLTRALTPDAVGVYFVAASIMYLASTVGRAGLNQAVVRLVAGVDPAESPDAAGLAARTVLRVAAVTAATASLTFAFVIIPVLATQVFDSPGLAQLALLLGCWSFVEALRLVSSEALRGFGMIGAATLLGDAGRQVVFGAAVAGVLLVHGRLTLDLVVGSAIAAGSLVLVLALGLLRIRRGRPSPMARAPLASTTLRTSLPMMVTALSLLAVAQGDVWLAGIVLPDADVGVYAATARLVLLVIFPLHISNVVLSPLVARLHAHGNMADLERTVRLGATVTAIPTLVIVVILLLFAEPILGTLYGDAFRGGASVLRILACGQLINALLGACGQTLLMTGNQKAMMQATMVGGVFFFSVGALTTFWFGPAGLAFASAVSVAGTNVALWVVVRRRLGIGTHATLNLKGIGGGWKG